MFPKLEEAKAALERVFDAIRPGFDVMAAPAEVFGDRPCATAKERVAAIQAMNEELKDLLEVQRAADAVGMGEPGMPGGRSGQTFAEAIEAAGYDYRTRPHVEVPFNAATFDGDYGDAQRLRTDSPGQGADRRYLYPVLNLKPVGREVTGVESFRQKSRTPADPTAMLRDIDETSNKPETATETELVQVPLKQIATVETGIPNIYLESSKFREFVDFDLRFSFSEAIDLHAVTEILDAIAPAGAEGVNLLEAAVHAAEEVASNGYVPSVFAAAPEDLYALLLMVQPGSGDYVGDKMAHALEGVRKVAVKGLASPIVLDPNALGTLYASPVDVKSFEEAAGRTNTSTVRIEANGLFLVQRADAASTAIVAETSA